jgi:hypothetical protein
LSTKGLLRDVVIDLSLTQPQTANHHAEETTQHTSTSHDLAHTNTSASQQERSEDHWYRVPRVWQDVQDTSHKSIYQPTKEDPNLSTPRAPVAEGTGHASFAWADLGKLDDRCLPTTAMARWMDEGQRDGVWDAVGYVKGEGRVEGRVEDRIKTVLGIESEGVAPFDAVCSVTRTGLSRVQRT